MVLNVISVGTVRDFVVVRELQRVLNYFFY